MARVCLAAGLLIAAWSLTPSAFADGIHLNGLSPRAIGRGGTNLGHADNGSILFDNPAAAVNIQGDRLIDIGGNLLITDMRYSDPDNDTSRDITVTPLPSFGIIQKSDDERWAYGIGVYAPAGFSETHNLQGQFPFVGEQLYKSFGALTKILPGVAYQVDERLSIGATFGMAISHTELEGPYYLQDAGVLTGLPTLIDLQATGATPVYSFGLQYKISDATTFGLAYQSESRFQLDGNALATVPILGTTRYQTSVDITWPRILGAGIRHQLCPHQAVSADLVWFNWSAAFDEVGIALKDAETPFFPNINEQLPLHWRDSVSVKLGYERFLDEGRTLRCGYVYHRNPIPEDTLTSYIQATLEHAVSFGYGFQWYDWDIDASYMFLFAPEIFVGQSGLVGGDFSNSTHQSYAHALGLSVIRRY